MLTISEEKYAELLEISEAQYARINELEEQKKRTAAHLSVVRERLDCLIGHGYVKPCDALTTLQEYLVAALESERA